MNDQELEILTGKCWACQADLTQLDGTANDGEFLAETGFTQCECKPKKKMPKFYLDKVLKKLEKKLPWLKKSGDQLELDLTEQD